MKLILNLLVSLIVYCPWLPFVNAEPTLFATSLVTCKKDSKLYANSFDVTFNPEDRSLHYNLVMTSNIDDYITATVDVYAYGFKFLTREINLCSIGWKQFCPLHSGDVEIESVQYIEKQYTDMIPGIAYQVPDIDAYARLRLYNNDSDYLACIEVFVSNGKTVSQIGVKWATAIVAGLGLLLSACLSTFGNSAAASHVSANTMSLFLYFQSVAVVSMQHVRHLPPIASAWAENMAWSMGLIRIHFMQKIFRWYVEATGGTPTLNLTSTITAVLTQRKRKRLVQLSNFIKRNVKLFKIDSYLKKRNFGDTLYGNDSVLIYRGIRRMAYSMNIEDTSVVCTGFTFFVLCGYVLAGFIIVSKACIELAVKQKWINQYRFLTFRQNWRSVLKGSLLRYIYIGFTQLTILSFWEFTERDSAAVIVIACLFLVMAIGLMLWSAYRTTYFARKSIEIHNNPAALLYGDNKVLNKYGFFYTMFNASHYWWNIVLLSYIAVKALFIGFSQASGQTQSLACWLLDVAYWIALIMYKPYLDKPTNIVNIFISTITVVNSFLFLFFSGLFNQNYASAAIMGWVFFIMNAAASFILLMMIIGFTVLMVLSKNPDVRFRPASDDRASFQRYSKTENTGVSKNVANELFALGEVAKYHQENWEDELYEQSSSSKSEPKENFVLLEDEVIEKQDDYITASSAKGLS
ncbi:hypothetical protein TBLA_0A02130 [Henningerozyma blattae CBS 6284]|uniref:ML-like domain-containing protein n=1 Tax=Henningerozyma blattae (strain ATCC 34711 / CBS 6284 / DSM 70876 / NBRC 10599 / NRRL Y-10934 / UCD 77-7) TaxID=1071380 RepID=I2GV62_HENB6|nr:hypothetical protein TBLA_0A02130 [Tetrapisispora blattae CBS 6284]CCH58014.1 hypothetical protein TBLA_0A02130 [Tetrapisispora blattae CBS 6284]